MCTPWRLHNKNTLVFRLLCSSGFQNWNVTSPSRPWRTTPNVLFSDVSQHRNPRSNDACFQQHFPEYTSTAPRPVPTVTVTMHLPTVTVTMHLPTVAVTWRHKEERKTDASPSAHHHSIHTTLSPPSGLHMTIIHTTQAHNIVAQDLSTTAEEQHDSTTASVLPWQSCIAHSRPCPCIWPPHLRDLSPSTAQKDTLQSIYSIKQINIEHWITQNNFTHYFLEEQRGARKPAPAPQAKWYPCEQGRQTHARSYTIYHMQAHANLTSVCVPTTWIRRRMRMCLRIINSWCISQLLLRMTSVHAFELVAKKKAVYVHKSVQKETDHRECEQQ